MMLQPDEKYVVTNRIFQDSGYMETVFSNLEDALALYCDTVRKANAIRQGFSYWHIEVRKA